MPPAHTPPDRRAIRAWFQDEQATLEERYAARLDAIGETRDAELARVRRAMDRVVSTFARRGERGAS